jgi:hypothetical protein
MIRQHRFSGWSWPALDEVVDLFVVSWIKVKYIAIFFNICSEGLYNLLKVYINVNNDIDRSIRFLIVCCIASLKRCYTFPVSWYHWFKFNFVKVWILLTPVYEKCYIFSFSWIYSINVQFKPYFDYIYFNIKIK